MRGAIDPPQRFALLRGPAKPDLAIAVLALVLLGGGARADNGIDQGYGQQVLLADGVAWTTIVIGANYEVKPVWITGASLLLAGAPIVHLLHGRSDSAVWSL